MPLSADSRDRLAAEQSSLVAILLAGGEAPTAFDAVRLRASAIALASKRQRAAARAWPELAGALGEKFNEWFTAYAAASKLSNKGGSLADGWAFAGWLAAQGKLPESAKLNVLAVHLRYSPSAEGLVPRRGAVLKATFLHSPRRLIVAVRLPWLGERWLSIPFWYYRADADNRMSEGKHEADCGE